MYVLKSSTIAAIMFLGTVGGASAIDLVKAMPSNYLDEVNAKLMAIGYREVRVIDAETNRLSAIDKDGSEVVLIISPLDRKITFSTYVHSHHDE